jgi:hypothetical protein
MIELELRTPQAGLAADHEVVWEAVARLRVAGHVHEVSGEERLIDFSMPVLSLRTGQRIRFEDDPEEWARNLPTVFHAPDLVVVVIEDDNPIPANLLHPDVERQAVRLREHAEARW